MQRKNPISRNNELKIIKFDIITDKLRNKKISNTINNEITPLDKIITKCIHDLTFKDIISLIFHSVIVMATDKNDIQFHKWKALYFEFKNEIEKQNDFGWPQIKIIRNDLCKCINILFIEKVYIPSENILTHLYRLLHIENYKRTYNYESYNYHKILNHKLNLNDNHNDNDNNNNTDKILVKYITLTQILSLFEKFMAYYIEIYKYTNITDSKKKKYIYNSNAQISKYKKFEYLLAKNILKKL